jgi:quercetin dioxygenase-like cupin family protein
MRPSNKMETPRMLKSTLAAALLLLPVAAVAQTPLRAAPADKFQFLSHQDIDAKLVPAPDKALAALFVTDHENHYVEFVKRVDHGNAVEQHAHWVDQITILSGEGVLTYGGSVTGAKDRGPGERLGGVQAGAVTQALHPGDFVLIPAGQPHRFDAAPGKTLNYVVFKVRS